MKLGKHQHFNRKWITSVGIILIMAFSMIGVSACGSRGSSSSGSTSSSGTSGNSKTYIEKIDGSSENRTYSGNEGSSSEEGCNSAVSAGENTETDEAANVKTSDNENGVDVSGFDQVLVDDSNITAEITGIETDGLWGYTWKIYLENKTDQNLMFSINNASVNGVMCDPLWATEVAGGKKVNDEISWPKSTLENNDIETVTQVEFEFRVYPSDDWSADNVYDETLTVYPMGEDNAQTISHSDSESDTVLFDNETARMIVTGYDPDNIWGYTIEVYLENKTDRKVMFAVDDVSVNGFMCDPFWATEVAAGKSSNDEISFSSSDFEQNDITDVTDIELSVRISDSDTYDTLYEGTFSLQP